MGEKMENRILKEYIETIHNPDENFEKILLKRKGERTMKKKIWNMVAIFVVILVIGATSSEIYAKRQWDIEFKEYQNREYEYAIATVKEAAENGYMEKVDMDYVVQNGIGVKIGSLIITDDHFESTVSFELPDDVEVDSQNFSFGYAIYDEENHVYGFSNRMRFANAKEKHQYDGSYLTFLYKELGVEYDKKDIFATEYNSAAQRSNISAKDGTIVSQISMESVKGFPKSQKIYIRVFDLGYSMVEFEKSDGKIKKTDAEDFTISGDAEWIFEINVPEKMYQRQSVELQVKENIPEFETEKITISETKLVVQGTLKGLDTFFESGIDAESSDWLERLNDKIYVTDGKGNRYNHLGFGSSMSKNGFSVDFAISKNELENQLFLHIQNDGQEYVSELILKD